jgi:N-acetylmuramoyl-L-alanine amidase
VTLRLAKLLEKKLKTHHECQTILTRYKDEYVSLKKRAALANKVKADLFISLHCNACPSHRLQGTETYFLGLTHDRYALAVAARENASLEIPRSKLNKILFDLLAKAKIKESADLAAKVQKNLVRHLRSKKYNPVTNLGVKQAPFYVLIGTDMPAVLVETSFIDHPREGRHLRDPNYLDVVAEGILKGVESYIHMIEPYKYSPMEAGKGG